MAYKDFRRPLPQPEDEPRRPGIPSDATIQRILDEAAQESGLPLPEGVGPIEQEEVTLIYDKFRTPRG